MAYNVYKNGVKVDTTNEKQYLFEGLKPDTNYTLGVSKVEDGKESEIATTEVKTKPLEKPVAPKNVRATDITETSFVLNWDHAPNGTYQVHIDGVLKHDNLTDNKVLLEGLEPNTEYSASVLTALNGMQSMTSVINVKTADVSAGEGTAEISQYHTGAGWYDLPNGERVRGKENAEEILKTIDEN